MERKIGDVIEYDRQKFEVVADACNECYFIDRGLQFCENLEKLIGSCTDSERKDKTDVCYKLVEE